MVAAWYASDAVGPPAAFVASGVLAGVLGILALADGIHESGSPMPRGVRRLLGKVFLALVAALVTVFFGFANPRGLPVWMRIVFGALVLALATGAWIGSRKSRSSSSRPEEAP